MKDFTLSVPDTVVTYAPCVLVHEEIFYNEPGCVADDEEGEGGEAGGPLVHPAHVHERRGQVDEAGDHTPGGVHPQPVQHQPDHPRQGTFLLASSSVQFVPVKDSPGEERGAPAELVRVLGQAPGQERQGQDVGDHDQEQE